MCLRALPWLVAGLYSLKKKGVLAVCLGGVGAVIALVAADGAAGGGGPPMIVFASWQ